MAEALALKVIPSFVEGVIGSNLSNLASKKLGLLVGVRGEITYLIVELHMMKAFLRSAEEKQETDFMAREWVRLVREASLDIENCMDKFKIYLNRRPNTNFFDWLGGRLHSLSKMRVRHEIAVEIQDLKYMISHISDCRLRYGIVATASGSSNFASATVPRFIDHQLGALFTQEAQLVGIDQPREKLVNLLIGDDMQRRVITVLGMGGLGKTTLTKKVYDDPQMVGEDFDCRAWITVSQSFNCNVLLKDIIRQVSPTMPKMDLDKMNKPKMDLDKMPKNYNNKIEREEDVDNMQSIDLIKKFDNLLQQKRYIIVLDDIWSIDVWESIKHALPENHNRSRVIITTRIEEVAKNCCADVNGVDYIYKMELLSEERSMELFQKRVFGPSKVFPTHLEEVANEVITKCGGLPLAIVAMAGVLKNMSEDQQQWSYLLNNLSSMLETNITLEGMKQVLLLSYKHLSYLLKPCFLYLSIFPEDHLIKRKNLIQLWIAEGLVTNQYAKSAEVMAEYFFNELVSRSLIIPSKVGWNGKVKSCRIHDVMFEVLVFKSMEENMVSIHGKQSITTLRDGNVIRRLSIQGDRNQIKSIPDVVDLSKVTSLSIYDFQKIPALFLRLRLLRILMLENYSFELDDSVSFIQNLSKLRNLRYLSLKGTIIPYHLEKIELIFSKSLSKLQNLVTLDIRDIEIYPELSSIAKLRQLRHFLMGDSFALYGWLKSGMLRNLSDMQTLVGLVINNTELIEELGFLTQLRVLKFHVDLDKPEILNSLCDSLGKLSGSLLSLTVAFWAELKENMNPNLDIKNPPSLLQSLHIRGICKMPYWVRSLSNLAKLTIAIDEKQLVNSLEIIKTLPNLIYLTYTSHVYFNPMEEPSKALLIPTGGFQRLKILKMLGMCNVHSIEFQEECMRVLEKIVIKHSLYLISVIGIRFFPCLQEIKLESVSKYIAEQLRLEAETHKNIPKLTVINVGGERAVF